MYPCQYQQQQKKIRGKANKGKIDNLLFSVTL